ncbi:MAG: glycosyltransferase [Candidatus Magasanikbacteria bacterium]|nr:glycosyltransferase [Candidatus Magasanikbacteria bacterium]
MQISVIIPAYNEEKTLAKTLESLIKQTTDRAFEVIVVNNASTDKTRVVAEFFLDKLDLKIIDEPNKGRGAARAAGCASAAGEIFLSTDADTILPSNWIDVLIKPVHSGVVGVTGTAKIEDCSFFVNIFFKLFQPALTKISRWLLGYYWLAGFSSSVTRGAYEKAGGFDKALNSLEDTDLARRVSRQGKIVCVWNCPVVFSGRRFKKGVLRGLLSYLPPFIMFLFKSRRVNLSDIR